MKTKRVFWISILFFIFPAAVVSAGDFDWIKDFNIRAEADPSGFRVRLGTRFQIGDAEVNAVIGNVEKPADAYMVCRLAEMSGKTIDYVMKEYKTGKTRGWGVIARNLGIKPGSKEFQALKQGDDLYGGKETGKPKSKGKGKR
ncbi:MAG: hypothetical protein ACUVWV_16240 [Thermodesulfobacteriota bacterium]